MSLATRRPEKGRPRGALFVCLLLATQLAHAACPATRIDLRVGVEHVHDGDTVRLADGRSLRLIGIDTPELARDGRPDEPLARAARDRLRGLLRDAGMRLALRLDEELEDRYGRLLAHAYLPDGRSIAAELLAEGLATQLVVPPNAAAWACNQQAERTARTAQRGVWALPSHRVVEARELDPARRGFAIVRGRILEVQPRRPGVRLVLEGGLVAWLPNAALAAFPNRASLAGARVEVRGRLRGFRDEQQVTIRHPYALTVLEDG